MRDIPQRALHIATLSAFALALPMLDLLGRHATFFVAHRSRPADLVALVIVLTIAVPVLPIAAAVVAERHSSRAGRAVHFFLLSPNFASLAERSHWFRNATTVAQTTRFALPAILTGNYPGGGGLPVFEDYPRNIFTLLNASHEMQVMETLTAPPTSSRPRVHRESTPSFLTRGATGTSTWMRASFPHAFLACCA